MSLEIDMKFQNKINLFIKFLLHCSESAKVEFSQTSKFDEILPALPV